MVRPVNIKVSIFQYYFGFANELLIKLFGFGKEFDLFISLNLDRKADLDFFSKETPVTQIFESILITRRLQKPRGKVLFFIDEIQNSSSAIKALRYFYEDMPELYLIAAGSLLESLMQKQVSFPVGRVEYLALRPCTFSEFLGAMGEIPLKEKLTSVSVTELLHNRLMELFKQYTLIGGMPEVVNHFINEKDLVALDSIYQTLLTGYRDDVEKYAPRPAIKEILRYVIKYGWEFAAQRITFEKFAHSNYTKRTIFRMPGEGLLLNILQDRKLLGLQPGFLRNVISGSEKPGILRLNSIFCSLAPITELCPSRLKAAIVPG